MLTDTTIKRLNALEKLSIQGKRINGLFRLMENRLLWKQAYINLHANKGAATPGVDGSSLDGFADDRMLNLIKLLKSKRYRFKPVKRVYIPKSNGKKRPLGIPAGDDKLIQEVVRMLLEKIYEPVFQNSSHGFRPGKSCHTALQRIKDQWTGIKWIISVDIKGFFDNIDHTVLLNLLAQKIDDKRFIAIIKKMLTAGYLEDWKFHNTYSGTPQGGAASPILANIYLHELDVKMNQLRTNYNNGKKRAEYKPYRKISEAIKSARKRIDKLKVDNADKSSIQDELDVIKSLEADRKQLPAGDLFDSGYKRLFYCRYADDCVPRAQMEVTLCQKCKTKLVCNCIRDGSRPSGIALQEEISNHSKLRWLKAKVVSVREKVSYKASGMIQGDEAIEPLLKCRKRIDEIKTEGESLTRDKHNRNLFTGYVVSGIKVA